MPDTTDDSDWPLRWSRPYMRRLRQGFAEMGISRCHVCQRDALGLRPDDPPPAHEGVHTHWTPHPAAWMSIQPDPALIWHGEPDRGELKMFISIYCKHCYAVTLHDSGATWSEDHPDLTRLSDEEQDAADPLWP